MNPKNEDCFTNSPAISLYDENRPNKRVQYFLKQVIKTRERKKIITRTQHIFINFLLKINIHA